MNHSGRFHYKKKKNTKKKICLQGSREEFQGIIIDKKLFVVFFNDFTLSQWNWYALLKCNKEFCLDYWVRRNYH